MIVARFRRDAKPEKPQTELRRRSRPKPSRGGKRSIQAQNEFLCLPSSILSSGFDIAGRGHRAKLFFSWLVEQGSLETDGQHYEIRKQGPLSGTWTLMAGNRGIAVARKTSPFTRSVQLSGPMGKLELRPTSALSRNFDLIRGDRLVASIRPEHPFTRRSRLTVYAPDADFPTLCFAFWLVALAWRRAEQS